ncbi:hypothetical protein YC2023_085644 [Brassica napus]
MSSNWICSILPVRGQRVDRSTPLPSTSSPSPPLKSPENSSQPLSTKPAKIRDKGMVQI